MDSSMLKHDPSHLFPSSLKPKPLASSNLRYVYSKEISMHKKQHGNNDLGWNQNIPKHTKIASICGGCILQSCNPRLEAAVHFGVDQGTIAMLLPAHSLQPSLAKPEGMVAMA